MKEISEINQKINAQQGVASVVPTGASAPVAVPPSPPGAARVGGGVTLWSDREALERVLAERAARERPQEEF